jgi:hypothetical protein
MGPGLRREGEERTVDFHFDLDFFHKLSVESGLLMASFRATEFRDHHVASGDWRIQTLNVTELSIVPSR